MLVELCSELPNNLPLKMEGIGGYLVPLSTSSALESGDEAASL